MFGLSQDLATEHSERSSIKKKRDVFEQEFAQPPYCGLFYLYLIFEEKDFQSDHREELLKSAIANAETYGTEQYDAMEYMRGEDMLDDELDENYKL